MKAGLSLNELAAKLEADAARRKDYVIDTRELKVLTSEGGTEVILPGQQELEPTQHFLRQLGTDLGIRADLVDRLRQRHPVQFDHLVNGLLDRWSVDHDDKPGKRMVRTYTDGGKGGQGIARAVLSDHFRRLDNYEVANVVLPILGQIPNVQFPTCEVTEKRMYIKFIAPLTQFDLQEFIDPRVHRFLPDGNPDYVQAGGVISNSEVGAGALAIDRMIFRLLCQNGLIRGTSLRKTHVGTQVTAGEDYTVYSDETLAQDDKALLMKVQDAVAALVDETKFQQLAAQFAETASGAKIEHPIAAMQVLKPMVGLTDGEGESVLEHLIKGGDLSKFGAINAITRAAQDVESYDRSVEMETLASDLIDLSDAQWDKVAVAA